MNKYFEVRRASEHDAEAIRQITAEAFEKYCELAGLDTIAALNETIEDIHHDIEEKIVLVAYIDNEVVGSVRVGINEETMEAYLSRFGVSTKYQNLGIGKALMNMVDITMRHNKVKRICLHTASKVFSLVRFYYGRGFYIDSTSKERGYVRALLVKDYE
ncbi:MAG: GNAT family N-acetyltransferase [Clostridia bacterium]|nr:GNAT family N-acetyltransferase [Clostridia bacterium]